MNEAWRRIVKDYIESYEAVHTLKHNGVVDDEGYCDLQLSLLEQIMAAFQSEVEKDGEIDREKEI